MSMQRGRILTLVALNVTGIIAAVVPGCAQTAETSTKQTPTIQTETNRVMSLAPISASPKPLRTLYVSTHGSDSSAAPTNEATPLRTIQKAAEMAQPGDKIVIRGGTYRESVRVKVNATADKPVVFAGYGKEKVVISGVDDVKALKASSAIWKPYRGKIYSLDLKNLFASKLNQDEHLFVDGEMLNVARTPNIQPGADAMQPGKYFTQTKWVSETKISDTNKWGKVLNGGATRVVFESNDLTEPDGAWDDASIWTKPEEHHSWGFGMVGPVVSYKKGRIEFDVYGGGGEFFKFAPGTRFYLYNTLSQLDAPGEWYLDKTKKRLYLWMPKSDDPKLHRIEMKRRDYAFDLSDSSYVTLQNLHVFGATITTDNLLGNGKGGGAWITGNRGSVDASQEAQGNAPAHHITLDGIHASYISHFNGTRGNPHGQWVQSSGIMLSGTEHLIHNSDIGYSAGNGIALFGPGHKVLNNIIHDVNYSGALASGIYINEAPENSPGLRIFPTDYEIAYNTLYRAGWGLIDGSNLYSTDAKKPARIHHNFLDAPGLMTKDVGGIRFVGHTDAPDHATKRGIRTNGTRVDHNFVRGLVAALGNPLYFDFSDGYVVDHNVVWDSVNFININDARNIQVFNNTAWTLQGGIGGNVSEPKFKDVAVRNNLLNKGLPGINGMHSSYVEEHNISSRDISDFVVDAVNGDFRLKPNTPAIDAGIEIPSYTQSTLDGNKDGKAAPDIGAFELGAPDWSTRVGANWSVVKSPTALTGTLSDDGIVTLKWKDNAANEREYIVERGFKTDHPNGGWEYVYAARLKANSVTYREKVDPKKEWFYRVRAAGSFYSNTFVVNAEKMARQAQLSSGNAFSLVGEWQAKLVQRLAPAPSPDKAHADAGISARAKGLVGVQADNGGWTTANLPASLESLGGDWADADGEAVFRKSFELPKVLQGKDLILSLGTLDDFDEVFFNGVSIGKTGKETGSWWSTKRRYTVSKVLVRPGQNVIGVRIWDHFGSGGFTGEANELAVFAKE